ncbi:cytochrome P450 [Aspergillus homomorphus CBS 101889]|uniref:Cytochrome P450 ClCP1 n=1 Tax=Aspergillus homomorphus (strain CBS 101889) TaxID=1450537 RepID=A0A395I9F6_ASPHC|nr:cytochrome P450 ClCP1 [Aspergillus homomorphus CBS 101889]RAL16419.1 cytochrome P450 ClCP1 [Aspergillus homomorphus CBS 101889]
MAVLGILILLFVLYLITQVVYNLYLHPLSKYPGPPLWRAFRLPFLLANIQGQLPHRIRDFHARYGDVIRVAPDELSFVDPRAWRDIYLSDREFVRPQQYKDQPPGKTAANLIACSEAEHARLRKALAPSFSERTAMQQEPILQRYIDLLFHKLDAQIHDASSTAAEVDLVEWINYLAFDVIGDLTWGSSFGCLEGLRYHPWVQTVSQFKAAIIVGALKFYPPLHRLLMASTPAEALKPVMEMWKVTETKVAERVAASTAGAAAAITRPDFVGTMLASQAMTQEEIEVNAMLIVAAGSESITTVLTGVINHLLQKEERTSLSELVTLLRRTFSAEHEITATRLKALPYLDAVLMEGMRLCPTIPDAMRRLVPRGSAIVAGQTVPAGITVSIPPWAAYRAGRNFTSPNEFAPARWLGGDERFRTDHPTRAFHPFSLGAHNCPGQNLAWMELRLVLARLLWRYDLTAVDLPVWEKQGIWWFWDKSPAVVRIATASR